MERRGSCYKRARMAFDSSSARWRLLGVALLFSTGGAAIKGTELSSWQVACLRSAVAAATLLLLLPAARRAWSWRSLVVGATYAATMILFVTANKLTTSANAIFLQATAPLYLLLLGPWLLKEPIRRRDLIFLALAAIGMGFFFLGTTAPTRLAPNPALGDALALASGLTFAFTIAGMRWLGTRPGDNAASGAVVAGNVIAALCCAPLALPLDGIGVSDAATILYLGVFQIGLAYAWMARALPHVPAFEASILLLAEPVFNPLWTWLTQGEKPGGWAIVGGAMILGATLVKAWLDRAPSATEP